MSVKNELLPLPPFPQTSTLMPESGRGAQGDIQPDGSYILSTYGDEDGATVGRLG